MSLPGDTLGTASIPPLGVKPGDEVLDGLYDGVPDQPLYVAAVLTGHDSPAAAGHTPRAWDWADALDIAGPPATCSASRSWSARAAPGLPPGTGCPAGAPHRRGPGLCRRAAPEAAGRPRHACAFGGARIQRGRPLRGGRRRDRRPARLHLPGGHPGRRPRGAAGGPGRRRAHGPARGAGELLEDVALFDVYAGKGIEDGKKSLAFSLRFRAADRTLTADEASAARESAVAVAHERFGAVQR